MSSLFVLRTLLFAGECFAASTLLIAFAWAATPFVKRASLRHALWLAAFGASLILPAAALIVPPTIVIQRTVEKVPLYIDAAPARIAVAEMAPPAFTLGTSELAAALFAAWLIGLSWALARLGLGAAGLLALRRQSKPHALASGILPGGRREGELRLSSREDGPLTWGVLKPVVLLPRSAVSWPKERLRAVLLHELAHVRRRDSLTQALALAVCALYWPNPLMWMGARALRREAEIAADDSAIVSGIKPSAYAGELLGLASEFRARRASRMFGAVAMAGPSALEARVKSALAPNVKRTGVRSMDAFKIACLGAAATMLLAFARADVVDVQSVTPPSPPAPVAAAVPPPAAPQALPAVPKLHALPAPRALPVVMADADDEADAAEPAEISEPAVEPEPASAAEDARAAEDAADAEDSIDMSPGKDIVIREWRDRNGRRVTLHASRATRAEIERAMHEVRRAQAQIARIQPQIQKAIADAKVQVNVARAMAKEGPRIRAEVERALAKVQPEIDRAVAETRVHVRAATDAHRNVRIEVDGGDASDDAGDSGEDADDESEQK